MGSKIVVRTPNHLGDCIMAIPMVNEVREAYPGSSVTVLVPANLAELYEQNPAVDNLLKIPPQHVHGLISVVKIREIIGPHRFDIGYILPPSFGAAAGFQLAGVKERIGYIADGRRMLLTRPLPLPAPLNCQHRAITYFDLLRRAADKGMEFVTPKLLLNEADVQRGTDLVTERGLSAETKYAAIAYHAVAESRRWGTSQYRALVSRILESSDLAVVLVGGPTEQRIGDDMATELNSRRVINMAGRATLRESAAILARAEYFVGNDSGPAHLAASVETPVIVLSGADDPKETSPLARHKRVIYHSELDCIGCVKNKCPLSGEKAMRCMTSISVGDVLREINDILAEVPV